MSSTRLTRTNIIPISRYTPTSAAHADHADATTIEEAESLGLDQPQAELPVDAASSPHWEKHFFMAPNVRFTRTPDRPVVKNRVIDDRPSAGDPIASMPSKHEASSPDNPAITSAQSSFVADIEQARPANVVQLTRLSPADHPTAHLAPTAVNSEWIHLSDHAFFELNISVPEIEVQPIAVPVPAAPTPAKLVIERACASDVSDLYRVVDCFGNAPRIAAPLPTTNVATPAPIATLEEAVSQEAKEAPQAARRSGPFSRSTAPSLPVTGRFVPAIASGEYELPSASLLQEPRAVQGVYMTQERLEQNADLLESVLEDFGIKGEIIHVRPGPVVTLYEFEPAPGVKSSRVINLADDIARSMSAVSARVAVVPGRNVIGIELPNEERETVYFRELIESEGFRRTSFKLALCLGKDIGGEPIIAELARMPHLLVAGTTGSGKSVAINTMILSLLYRLKPEECRLIMVDPKMLELSVYDGIPHLLTPVVTDSKKAVTALKWAVREMEDRYRKMAKLGVRNIACTHLSSFGETIDGLVTPVLGGLIKFDWNIERSLWPAYVDSSQLELAMLNLIFNARDAMPSGGAISVSGANHSLSESTTDLLAGDYVVLKVGDNGSGISQDLIARVIEPFFTTKEVGKGTGLGLSTVYGFAKQSGGTLVIDSEVGRGTCMEIWLPRAAENGARPTEIAGPIKESRIQHSRKPPVVLLVEDSSSLREITSKLLEDSGFEVITASDGLEAKERLSGDVERIDVILTDFAMPQISGLEVVRFARELRRDWPAIIISGYADVNDIRDRPSDVPLLSKPVSDSILIETLWSALEST